jgi:hypothetical protein
MKIRVSLVVEVDPKEWAQSNGRIVDADGNFTASGVREDVRSYLLNHVQMAALIDETSADVTLA